MGYALSKPAYIMYFSFLHHEQHCIRDRPRRHRRDHRQTSDALQTPGGSKAGGYTHLRLWSFEFAALASLVGDAPLEYGEEVGE